MTLSATRAAWLPMALTIETRWRALVPALFHGRQRVDRLARLGDGEQQGVVVDHRVAIAELRGVLDAHGQTGHAART